MKDYPQNTQQWADEAYFAMKAAWDVITEHNPLPNDTQKEKLIDLAVTMACDNRDIDDPKFIAHALDYVKSEFQVDYDSRNPLDKINFTLCFLLAYFDAHQSLTMITEEVAESAMTQLKNNYDLSYAGHTQSNILSINFSSKN